MTSRSVYDDAKRILETLPICNVKNCDYRLVESGDYGDALYENVLGNKWGLLNSSERWHLQREAPLASSIRRESSWRYEIHCPNGCKTCAKHAPNSDGSSYRGRVEQYNIRHTKHECLACDGIWYTEVVKNEEDDSFISYGDVSIFYQWKQEKDQRKISWNPLVTYHNTNAVNPRLSWLGLHYSELCFLPISQMQGIPKSYATLKGYNESTTRITFSPNSRLLASSSTDGRVLLWDISTQSVIVSLPGEDSLCTGIVFSADGSELICSWTSTLKIWNVVQRRLVHNRSISANYWHHAVAFSQYHDLMATATGWKVEISKIKGGWGTYKIGHSGFVGTVALSNRGNLLAWSGDNGSIYVWDLQAKRGLWELRGHSEIIHAIAFSSDNSIVATSSGPTVQLWSIKDGSPLLDLQGHNMEILDLVFSPNDKWLVSTAKEGGGICMWRLDLEQSGLLKHQLLETVTPLLGLIDDVQISGFQNTSYYKSGVTVSPDGKFLAYMDDRGSIEVWSMT